LFVTRTLLAITALAAGCYARVGDGEGNLATTDAGDTTGSGSDTTGGDVDAGAQGGTDAPTPACANGRKVYLAFEGVTLTQATTSDATQNRARWLTNTTSTVPPWRTASGSRAAQIASVVDGVKSRLAMTPIEVVTTRPTTGPYVMIAFGGERTGDGGSVGTIYSYATSYHDCGDTVKSDVGWVSDMNGSPESYVADLAVGAIGWGLGLDGTTSPADCMCGWANGCDSQSGACTLSSSIATSIQGNVETACQPGTQNEVAAFTTQFCQ
jgi:hypothetical protein